MVSFAKRPPSPRVHQLLAGEHSCIVVITCGGPTPDGEMAVEMVYEGDAGLASFLLQGAQQVLHDELEAEET